MEAASAFTPSLTPMLNRLDSGVLHSLLTCLSGEDLSAVRVASTHFKDSFQNLMKQRKDNSEIIFKQARAICKHMEIPAEKIEAQKKLSISLAKQGLFKEAKHEALQIKERAFLAATLSAICVIMVEANCPDKAEKLMTFINEKIQIPYSNKEHKLYIAILEALGEAEIAIESPKMTAAYKSQTPLNLASSNPNVISTLLQKFAQLCCNDNYFESALSLLEHTPHQAIKDQILAVIITSLIDKNMPAKAAELTEEIGSSIIKINVLLIRAKSLSKEEEQIDVARDIIIEAFQAAINYNNPENTPWLLNRIAMAEAEFDLEGALDSVEKYISPGDKQRALGGIAISQAIVDGMDGAREIIASIHSVEIKESVKLEIVKALTEYKKTEEAQDLAFSFSSEVMQQKALASISCTLSEAGSIQESKDVLTLITHPEHLSSAIHTFALALAKRNFTLEAQETADLLKNPAEKLDVLLAISESLTRATKRTYKHVT